MKAAMQGTVCTNLEVNIVKKNFFVFSKKKQNLPAVYFVFWERKRFGHFVFDGERKWEGEDEIGKCEIEDKNIPRRPSLVFDDGYQDQAIANH